MSSGRCSRCDINFPNDEDYCHVCGNETWNTDDQWDSDWPEKVEVLLKRNSIRDLKGIPNLDLTLLNHKGRLWVVEELLEAEGYECVDLGVIYINGDYYELSGRRDGEIPAWWVTLIEWEREFDDLPTLSFREYEELEVKRGIR